MATVNITMNGQKVSVPAGITVLEAAEHVGVDIPTLCHHPALAPIGACRVCLVEVKGQRVLQPACTFRVSEGMEIQTESPQVVAVRKFVLDMLFSERNHYCMFCEISGDCELQDLGYRYGLDHWVYPTYRKGYPVDATRDTFLMDHNRCILCRRCVRACSELVANHTLGLRQRGASSMIHADLNVPFGESSCIECGTCLQVCPTGALIDKRSAYMGRDIQSERIPSTCSQCSIGCGTVVVTRGGNVLRIEGDWDAAVNGGLLCQKGRFAPLHDQRPRVTQPMVRRQGRLESATWDEALLAAATGLAGVEAGKVGLLVSSQATNEALYLASKLFREALGSGQVRLLNEVTPRLPGPQGSLADLTTSDLILLVGGDPVDDQPVVSFLIKRAVDQGARLIVVDDEENKLAPFAHTMLEMARLDEAIDIAARAENPVVVYGHRLGPETGRALARLEGARLIALQLGANTHAAAAYGLTAADADMAGTEALFVLLGEQEWNGTGLPGARGAFRVVQASYQSALTEGADVVLPAAIWSERAGSLTNCEGRVQKVNQAVQPQGEARADWDILSGLAARLGNGLPTSLDEISASAAQGL